MSLRLVPLRVRRRRRLPERLTLVCEWRWDNSAQLAKLDAYYGAAGRCEGMGV